MNTTAFLLIFVSLLLCQLVSPPLFAEEHIQNEVTEEPEDGEPLKKTAPPTLVLYGKEEKVSSDEDSDLIVEKPKNEKKVKKVIDKNMDLRTLAGVPKLENLKKQVEKIETSPEVIRLKEQLSEAAKAVGEVQKVLDQERKERTDLQNKISEIIREDNKRRDAGTWTAQNGKESDRMIEKLRDQISPVLPSQSKLNEAARQQERIESSINAKLATPKAQLFNATLREHMAHSYAEMGKGLKPSPEALKTLQSAEDIKLYFRGDEDHVGLLEDPQGNMHYHYMDPTLPESVRTLDLANHLRLINALYPKVEKP